MRCEADHTDGNVCHARLRENGTCPTPFDHVVPDTDD